MSDYNQNALRDLQNNYDLINPGCFAIVMVDRETKKYGLCDNNGTVICPCVCDYVHTNACYGNEVGDVRYKGLRIELRIIELELAKELADPDFCIREAFFKYRYFDEYVGLYIQDTTGWNYSEDDGMVEVEPGVKVSEEWALAKGLDVYKPSEDPKKLFDEFVAILSEYHEMI